MVYLIYSINGNKKKIKVNSIKSSNGESIDNIDNIVKRGSSTYEYVIKKQEQDTFKKLLNLLQLWNDFTKKHEIKYWASGGTLLGAIRHGGFIPYDNDIDVCVFLSDFEKVKKNLDDHETLSYFESRFGIKIYVDDVYPFLDIFVCDYRDKSKIDFCGILTNDNKPTWLVASEFPRQHVYEDELFPLREVEFENTTIMVPKMHKCLFRTFSTNCLTDCVVSNHVKHHLNVNKQKCEKNTKLYRNIYDLEESLHLPKVLRFTYYRFLPHLRFKLHDNNDD